MSYWLVKSEPEEYSFADLQREGKTIWDGVRNAQAQKYLRAMKAGEEVLYYHTGREKAIVGIARVSREAFPEPGDSRYVVVELIPIRKLLRCIPLIEIKAEPSFSHIELVRQPRLSVMPISSELWRWIMDRETV